MSRREVGPHPETDDIDVAHLAQRIGVEDVADVAEVGNEEAIQFEDERRAQAAGGAANCVTEGAHTGDHDFVHLVLARRIEDVRRIPGS